VEIEDDRKAATKNVRARFYSIPYAFEREREREREREILFHMPERERER
jgi:hypothetical protein